MVTFNVFVEGPVDDSPTALPELADAISQRYGLPAADLVARLKRGRFRVKSNVDHATAERYRRDLEAIGARVLLEDSSVSPTATPVAGAPIVARTASSPSLPPTGLGAAGPAPQRPTPPPAASRAATPPSGLAAAGPSQPMPAISRTSTPPSGLAAAGPSQQMPAISRTATPPSGLSAAGPSPSPAISRTSTPPSGLAAAGPSRPTPAPAISQTGTPPSGLSAAGPSQPMPAISRTSTPPSGLSAAGPSQPAVPRTTTPPPSALAAHQRPSTPIPSEMTSGLAAAFSQEIPTQADLGALGAEGFSLASLDGEESGPAEDGSFDVTTDDDAQMPASIGPAPSKPKPAPVASPKSSAPLDLFKPPDEGEDLPVNLATEEVEERAHKAASAPAESARASQPLSTTRRTPVSMAVAEPMTTLASREVSRASFVMVVAVGLALAFIPVHIIANVREKAAYGEIDRKVAAADASADTMETYLALDGTRAKLRDEKESKQRMIALTSMLLWAVLASAITFGLLHQLSRPRKTTASN